ncbi:hypothetical protein GCM10010219_45890 [Streptomyces netropsis]|nr:hypothetical protein GCM10010219_45890 [Streptomyces netropsis]
MKGPYISAVSSRLTPASSAACTVRRAPSPLCWEAVYAQCMGMHPRPIAPTSSAVAPIVLRSTRRTLPFLAPKLTSVVPAGSHSLLA